MRISDWSSDVCSSDLLEDVSLPLSTALDDIPALALTPDQAGSLRQGRVLVGIAAHDGQHLATEGEMPVALVEVLNREVRVVRGFNLTPDVEGKGMSITQERKDALVKEHGRAQGRTEGRSVGKGWVSTCRSRGGPEPK